MEQTRRTKQQQQLHIAMFPWFAMGHLTPYMQLSNKLADLGHRISFFLPSKTHPLISPFNSHPDLITLVPVPLPQVPGLDPNIQTTADCNAFFPTHQLLATAYDRTAPFIESSLHNLKPDVVFHDVAHWLPPIAKKMGILAVGFIPASSAYLAHLLVPRQECPTESEIRQLPPDFPHPCLALRKFEARFECILFTVPHGEGITLMGRLRKAVLNSDAIAAKTCRELEGHYLDYVAIQSNKPVITTGATIPVLPSAPLKEDLAVWLGKFEPKSVMYCALGSEFALSLSQFQEFVLGIELVGLPFLIALRSPVEADSIETALPEGFGLRTRERGMVTGEWVQQQHILAHGSVGCFVTHCGWGSLTEGLIGECQLVLLPCYGDQCINARLMSGDLKVGVEVEKGEEDGLFDRYGVRDAVKLVMNMEDDGVEIEVKMNHDRWRSVLSRPGLEKSCVQELVTNLKQLMM